MVASLDLVIRNGLVVDGTGTDPFEADVALRDGRIVAIGQVAESGTEEIDAKGRIVTPGFIDPHTHLDGHVTWESQLYPATGHGITTAVIGNCGVGFAPCRAADHDSLIELMETVEDIGFADLSAGLPWGWESFPNYLDALDARRFNMDVGALAPHSTIRAYVMGERALEGVAGDADRAEIASVMQQASRAGALGFGTSTLRDQRTKDGRHIPSFLADEAEFTAIAQAMAAGGGGVFQTAIEFNHFPHACDELEMFARVGKASGQPILFSLKQTNRHSDGWRDLLAISDRANAAGVVMHPQVLGRPTGAIMGLQTTLHPFSRCPSFRPIANLSLDEKVAALRNPELRAALLVESEAQQQKLPERVRGFAFVFPLDDPPNYEPGPDECIDALAAARGVSAIDFVYDLLLEKGGHQLLLLAGGNFAEYSLDPALAMLRNPHSVPGLGDAGAHAGIICDASATTTMMSYWVRDRQRGERLGLPEAVRMLTSDGARALGLADRGTIAVGRKADLNVIDPDRIALRAPRPVKDLPAGGTRLVQDAVGYDATIVSGQIVHRHDQPTEALPGRLIRRQQVQAS